MVSFFRTISLKWCNTVFRPLNQLFISRWWLPITCSIIIVRSRCYGFGMRTKTSVGLQISSYRTGRTRFARWTKGLKRLTQLLNRARNRQRIYFLISSLIIRFLGETIGQIVTSENPYTVLTVCLYWFSSTISWKSRRPKRI